MLCVLQATVVVVAQDWWTVINPRKAVLPKLWRLLRAGADGSAAVVCPHLLPLLSTMPPDDTRLSAAFLHEFFDSMLAG